MMNIDEKYVKEYLMNNILGNLIADRLYTGSFAFVCDNARGVHPKQNTLNPLWIDAQKSSKLGQVR